VDEEKCMGCGCCVETCPKSAHGMKVVEPPESYGGDSRMNLDT
jgi:ferredoxin